MSAKKLTAAPAAAIGVSSAWTQFNPDDKAAVAIVATIDELFAVDTEARAQQMNLEAWQQLRQQKARPLIG